jgi:hypothetical protein
VTGQRSPDRWAAKRTIKTHRHRVMNKMRAAHVGQKAKALTQKAIHMALAGDPVALRLLLNYVAELARLEPDQR